MKREKKSTQKKVEKSQRSPNVATVSLWSFWKCIDRLFHFLHNVCACWHSKHGRLLFWRPFKFFLVIFGLSHKLNWLSFINDPAMFTSCIYFQSIYAIKKMDNKIFNVVLMLFVVRIVNILFIYIICLRRWLVSMQHLLVSRRMFRNRFVN